MFRAKESDVYVHLPPVHPGRMYPDDLVEALSRRVMEPAVADLNATWGPDWGISIEPWLVREGPALTFKLAIRKRRGWELAEMGMHINDVFRRHWQRETKQLPPPEDQRP